MKKIDWEQKNTATRDEVLENARALRAEIRSSHEFRIGHHTACMAERSLGLAIDLCDLPFLRHMLNDAEWRIER
jgi:hypothetical protein